MTKLLWSPSPEFMAEANITAYALWLRNEFGIETSGYHSLWEWSVNHSNEFWKSIFQYFHIIHDGSTEPVTNGMPMPETKWFEGVSLSYAEHIFRNKQRKSPAIICYDESGSRIETSWTQLETAVAALQLQFKEIGLQPGDRVVAYMPASTEATIAFLATNALGAIWSSCSPDFGTPAVVERFAQVEPKILIAVGAHQYGGKVFNLEENVRQLIMSLPTLQASIVLTDTDNPFPAHILILHWKDIIQRAGAKLTFLRVPFNHPIWILYSSGTTGTPKAIVHGTGGILIEQLKYGTFHNDFKPGERCIWYTTTGWMMWNYIQGCLLSGCTLVLYDGSPAYPNLTTLWKITANERIQHFGTSASFILANVKVSLNPSETCDLSALRSIGSTGSTLPPEGFEWVYKNVKSDLWLSSMSGGTDVCSAFVGGNPTLPVYAGEIQCRALGCKLEAFDERGLAVVDQVGEMVIEAPMPSMPLFFWNDIGKKRYLESYLNTYAGIWRHGDWIRITSHEGIVIYGRSDATLNRGGIRIGTSEIYRAVDEVAEVKDSLIVCIEKSGGNFWMPLFVVMENGKSLTAEISREINMRLRKNYSPRHVPDEIIVVPDIPYTISGKKSEMPVKKILMGVALDLAANRAVLQNPKALDFFIALAAENS